MLRIIFRDKTQLYRKAYNGFLGPGRLGVAAGERETTAGTGGGRFRQPDRTPFFRSERRPKAGVSRK